MENTYSDINVLKDSGFYSYLKLIDVDKDTNVLILLPVHHYYYDFNDIKNVRTLVHKKELNKIPNLSRFINSIVQVLSKDSKFIGCFFDNHIHKRLRYRNRFFHWVFNLIDGRVQIYLSRKKIIKTLTNVGFKIMDITEIDGLTYFCVKKM